MQNKKTKLKRNKKKKNKNIYIYINSRSMLPIKWDEWNKFTPKNAVLNTYTKTSSATFSVYNGIIGFCLL